MRNKLSEAASEIYIRAPLSTPILITSRLIVIIFQFQPPAARLSGGFIQAGASGAEAGILWPKRPGSEIRDRASPRGFETDATREPAPLTRVVVVVFPLFATPCNTERPGRSWPRSFPECETHAYIHPRVHTCAAACRRSARCKCATGAPDCLIAAERARRRWFRRTERPESVLLRARWRTSLPLPCFPAPPSHFFSLWPSVYPSFRLRLFLAHYIFLIPGVSRPALTLQGWFVRTWGAWVRVQINNVH